MIKIISDKNKKSKQIKLILEKKLTRKIKNPKIVIVIGGDGFMLQTLKKTRIHLNVFMV